jgi:hypothetical protein
MLVFFMFGYKMERFKGRLFIIVADVRKISICKIACIYCLKKLPFLRKKNRTKEYLLFTFIFEEFSILENAEAREHLDLVFCTFPRRLKIKYKMGCVRKIIVSKYSNFSVDVKM